MKSIKKLLATLLLTLMLVLTMLPVVSAEGDYNEIDNNYETISYDTKVVLDENNVYHIEERIKVNFIHLSHGIYRYIPYRGNMQYEEDGVVKDGKYRASIKNVKVNGHQFDKSSENGNVTLQIGDKDVLLTGEQEYVISFDFDPGDDKIASFDKVYINLIPTGWRTSIQDASFSLTLPKEIPAENISVFSGEFGTAFQSKFAGEVVGNVVTAQAVEPLAAFEGVTVYAEMDEGYFVGERTDNRLIMIMWVVIGLIPLLAIGLYLLFGIDKPIIKVMTVSPPNGITSAEVGYIMDSSVDNKDVLSLIIYWADKGYLTIEQTEEDSFILSKLTELPSTVNGYEKTMFDGLFASGDVVDTTELKSSFFSTLEMTKTLLRGKFSKAKSTSLYTGASLVCQGLVGLLSIVPLVCALIIGGYIEIANEFFTVGAIFALVVTLGCYIGGCVLASKWYVLSKKAKVGGIIGVAIPLVLTYFGMVALALWQLPSIFPTLAAIIGSTLAILCTCAMPRRTKQCNDWFGELLGLREFIELAEKERIEQLVMEDPSYFYNILPYAYVLGVSDTWSKKFESIAVEPPSWYYGGGFNMSTFNTYLFLHSFNNCMTNMNNNLSIPPVDMSGSKSGGGFSGGGFSGGGFSGGGGGSW